MSILRKILDSNVIGTNASRLRSVLEMKNRHFGLNAILVMQIIVALIWIGGNIQSIPLYGDTDEYIRMSESLRGHSYRTVFYPWILHLLMRVSTTFFVEILYSIQWILSLIAFYYFFYIGFRLVSGSVPPEKAAQRGICTSALFPALFMASNPLITHFNLSVLTDGMALSFSLIFITSLLSYFYLKGSKKSSFSIMAVSFILMSLMRVEKLYFGIMIVFLVLLYEHFEGRRSNSKLASKYTVSILITVVSVILLYSLITFWRKIDYGEPGLSVYAVKQVLVAFSSPEAFFHRLVVFGKYLLSPLVFIGEWLPAAFLSLDAERVLVIAGGGAAWDLTGWSTLWTYYHMLTVTPLLTTVYLVVFILGFGSQCVFLLITDRWFNVAGKMRIIFFLSMLSTANALLFGFFSSFPDMHIRYALPSYISFLLTMLLLTPMSGLGTTNNENGLL